jgi:hypothetical protein
MEHTPSRDETVVQGRRHPPPGRACRHRTTWAWMMVGLLLSASRRRGAWPPWVVRRAPESPSTGRRWRRWLAHETSAVPTREGPRLPQALGGWGGQRL